MQFNVIPRTKNICICMEKFIKIQCYIYTTDRNHRNTKNQSILTTWDTRSTAAVLKIQSNPDICTLMNFSPLLLAISYMLAVQRIIMTVFGIT